MRHIFCTGSGSSGVNFVPEMETCGLLSDIVSCGERLISNAESLILNMTTNLAEVYNSVICKFVGGKRVNYSQKKSHELRCTAAPASFNLLSENKIGRFFIL